MCGIAGCFGLADLDAVARMGEAQKHRGPDDCGNWINCEAGVALSHVRLSIIGCSAAGRQPMEGADGRLTIVFNGEIYNYAELRRELERSGYRFRTGTDTEVLLASYAAWGSRCVERLIGMFAFAVFDKRPPEGAPDFVLVRDRLGIKPLLYVEKEGALWFASELRALRAVGAAHGGIDPEAILDYLAVGAVFQPRTFVEGVSALPPGSILEIRGNKRSLVRYWDLHQATTELRRELAKIDEPEAAARLRALLEEATRYHLVADVPVGAFLSGGIDSTAVVALMQQVTGEAVRTFSVGFESANERYDERRFARLAADHLQTEHHEVVVTARDAPQLFEAAVSAIDQPSVDGINTWIVSRAARADLKVALSGLGGDEIFAGYSHFNWLAEDGALPAKPRWIPDYLLEAAMRLRPNGPALRALFSRAGPGGRLSMLRRLVGNHAFIHAIQPRWRHEFRERLVARHASWLRDDADPVQQTSYGEVNGYLLSTLLRDSDIMSMAHGLEVRPVLLHHPLVEFGYALPALLKLRNGQGQMAKSFLFLSFYKKRKKMIH